MFFLGAGLQHVGLPIVHHFAVDKGFHLCQNQPAGLVYFDFGIKTVMDRQHRI
jgi:hypothetical protein